jgi:hypothetical protein
MHARKFERLNQITDFHEILYKHAPLLATQTS